MLSFILGLLTFGFVFTVPNGNIGVRSSFGKVIGTASPGIHVKAPLGISSNTNIDVMTQSSKLDLIAGSKENTTVTFKTTINWHIDPSKVEDWYKQYGYPYKDNIEKQFISPTLNSSIKVASTNLLSDEQLRRQQETRETTLKLAREDMLKYHIIVDDIIFDDIDFGKDYNASFERKAIAKQDAETASFLKVKAQNEADAQLVQASGSARARLINAEAEAKSQQLLQQSLTPELLQKMAIEKWNGSYPQTLLGGNSVPLIQLNK